MPVLVGSYLAAADAYGIEALKGHAADRVLVSNLEEQNVMGPTSFGLTGTRNGEVTKGQSTWCDGIRSQRHV